MGFFKSVKNIGKKIGSTVVDVAQTTAPVVDVFYPGMGTAISQGGGVLERAGLDDSPIKETNEAAKFSSTYIQPITSMLTGGSAGGLSGLGGMIAGGSIQEGIYNSGQGKANQIMVDAIRGLEQQQYQNELAKYNADVAYAQQANAVAQRNAAARASAARQTEANRLRAAREAQRQRSKTLKRANRKLSPYADAGVQALPYHNQAVANAGALGQQLTSILGAGGLPRKSMLDPSLGIPLPVDANIRQQAIAQQNYVPPQVEQQLLQESVQEVAQNETKNIPQKFKDLTLNKKQKRRMKNIRSKYGKEGAKIYQNHLLQKAQDKPVKRKLRTKLSKLRKASSSPQNTQTGRTSQSTTNSSSNNIPVNVGFLDGRGVPNEQGIITPEFVTPNQPRDNALIPQDLLANAASILQEKPSTPYTGETESVPIQSTILLFDEEGNRKQTPIRYVDMPVNR